LVIFNITEKMLAVLCLLTPENYLQMLTSCLVLTVDACLFLIPHIKILPVKVICTLYTIYMLSFLGGKGAEEAAENRNYLAQRMTDELNEIIRVLQLTTYDEEEWDADNLTVMKKAQNAIVGKVRAARDWLEV
jgi:vinculin